MLPLRTCSIGFAGAVGGGGGGGPGAGAACGGGGPPARGGGGGPGGRGGATPRLPGKGDWAPPSELAVVLVDTPNILLGEPGPETSGPRTPGTEKAELDTATGVLAPPLPGPS